MLSVQRRVILTLNHRTMTAIIGLMLVIVKIGLIE